MIYKNIPEFLYRDDDPNDQDTVKRIIESLGVKPIIVGTLAEMEDKWHNELVGVATDWQIQQQDSSGADELLDLIQEYGFKRPMALLTGVADVRDLKKQYGEGSTGQFHSIFNKEDALLNGDFENFVKECLVYGEPVEEKLKVYCNRLEELKWTNKPIEWLISSIDTSLELNDELSIYDSAKTIGDLCNIDYVKSLNETTQNEIIFKLSEKIKHTEAESISI